MDKMQYIQVLENAIPQMNEFTNGDFYLLQDNFSVHTAKEVMKWIGDNNVNLIDFPALSPDLNPMMLWAQLTNNIYRNGRGFENITQLKASIIQEWNNLTKTDIKNQKRPSKKVRTNSKMLEVKRKK